MVLYHPVRVRRVFNYIFERRRAGHCEKNDSHPNARRWPRGLAADLLRADASSLH
jgi:hypothetical protein